MNGGLQPTSSGRSVGSQGPKRDSSRTPVFKRVLRRARRELLGPLFWETNHDLENTVFVAGSGRSGTTWLAEIINYRNDHRLIFEPLRPDRVRLGRTFGSGGYVRPSDLDPHKTRAMEAILSGRIRSRWTDQYNTCLLPARRLVKDIRANLMLNWFRARFADVPIVFIVRHPLAVAASRSWLAANGQPRWEPNLGEFLSQAELIEDFLDEQVGFLSSLRQPLEQHVACWSIENRVALSLIEKDPRSHLVFYEELVERPASEIGRLFTFLGRELAPRALQIAARPSAMASEASLVRLSDPKAAMSWARSLDEDDVAAALRIVDRFGLGSIYGAGPRPHSAALSRYRHSQGGLAG
jgi:hypothetical protein